MWRLKKHAPGQPMSQRRNPKTDNNNNNNKKTLIEMKMEIQHTKTNGMQQKL